MSAVLTFEFPPAWQVGLPLAAAALAWAVWRQRRLGLNKPAVALLVSLRAVALLLLVFLAARPVWMARQPVEAAARRVALLLDRSESMSLEEGDRTRFDQALGFARRDLLPALRAADLPVRAWSFAREVEPVEAGTSANLKPNGRRTNLGGAIVRAFTGAAVPPLAVIALTDGVVNERADNARALAALVDARAPFIGVGFGSDLGVRTLALRQVDAPAVAAPRSEFNVSAQLELVNPEETPGFELVLFRDGQLLQKKAISAGHGSRCWLESFRVAEPAAGVRHYTIQLLPPNVSGLKCVNSLGTTAVRITEEKELRVLYVQGALTWDYKFVGLALKEDPGLKLTGLTRTSRQSIFRQNVEAAGELVRGFPTSIEELAPFRVVVLSNLKPIDLSPAQQELLARFAGELGGGVLMIGGPTTFDASWQGSRLEQLLPVVFAGHAGVVGLDRPFRLQLTEEAARHPVFQISDRRVTREAWAEVPAFTQYGRVDAAKPGAQVWAVHQQDEGPRGRRILMAAQRYGAGQSAVICIQNFWRWRLARDVDPQQFDRFWRQLFRFLGEASRQEVSVHLADQELRPEMDVRVVLEKQPNPGNPAETSLKYRIRVATADKQVVQVQSLDLAPRRPVEMTFRAEKAGLYTVTVEDAVKQPVATRSVEIRDLNVEFQNTARDLETLRQWAALTGGLAVRAEDCRDARDIAAQLQARLAALRRHKPARTPVGVNGWMLALVLGCLAAEWVLRKRWGLV